MKNSEFQSILGELEKFQKTFFATNRNRHISSSISSSKSNFTIIFRILANLETPKCEFQQLQAILGCCLLSEEFRMLSDYLKALQFSETARILHPHDAAPDARSVPAGRSNADGCISDNLDFFIAHHEDELFSLLVTSHMCQTFLYESNLINVNMNYYEPFNF